MGTSTTYIFSGQKWWRHNTFTSRRPKVAIFADIINIVTMFMNNIFLDSKS